ncbi:hypothetical protein AVEN_120140-1 [Araneus ventricosus]|uniref:G-protein coupled receptors family 1 profile domain-containing protein n=1 Tax=Araneus ventricosus TaxID=182803 RepID=A0A4Y2U749_ARAVE|nr:hypothetical protein AVEN_120140-1 [Araneus ventricosus]
MVSWTWSKLRPGGHETTTKSVIIFSFPDTPLDRYGGTFVAVTRPLRPRMSKSVAYSIIMSVWTLSSLLSLPSLLYATTITYKYADQGHRTLCYLIWPDQALGKSYTDHV